MQQPQQQQEPEIYDLFGIGFGPANVALAISLSESEEAQKRGLKFGFMERRPSFAWHPVLLLPGAQLQVSPLKDLATMRDPTSTFTFVNYLHKMGRLSASINREANIPSRREWSAYLTWCAERLSHLVNYGEEVVCIEPVANYGSSPSCVDHALSKAQPASTGNSVRLLRITSRRHGSDELVIRLARNITVGVGGSPSIPHQFSHIYPKQPWEQASRIVHSGTFLPSLNAIEPELAAAVEQRLGRSSPASKTNWPLRFAVIGAGQSSAEMLLHLRRTFPSAHIQMIFRASAIVPSDDSSFVNSAAFDPERTDAFWKAGEQEREAWRTEFKRTNYSVVRNDVLNELSEVMYDQKIELPALYPGSDGPAEGRVEITPNTFVETADTVTVDGLEQVRLVIKSMKTAEPATMLDFDAVFMGTGFIRRADSLNFLSLLRDHLPILDVENASKRRAALGFSDDDDTRTMAGEDEAAKEMVRERVRGITRDYRLVPYLSDSFTPKARGSSRSPSTSVSPSRQRSAASSRRNSSTSDETLANNGGEFEDSAAARPRFEPNIYSFGGNEATHGLSDSLLSICAWRAGEVTDSLLKRLPLRPAVEGEGEGEKDSALADAEAKTAGILAISGGEARRASTSVETAKAKAQAAAAKVLPESMAHLSI